MTADTDGDLSENAAADQGSGLPTYVKGLLAIAIIVVVLIVVLDMLVIAGGL